MFMITMLKNSNKIFLFVIIIITFSGKSILGDQAYFDLSDNEIEIQTNFNGLKLHRPNVSKYILKSTFT